MRILRMILIAATLSSTGACLVTARGGTSSGRPAPGQPGATVSGVVSDARTRAVISQAAVDIVDVRTHQKVTTTSTDGSGRYMTAEVAPGQYQFHVRRNGYDVKIWKVDLNPGTSEINIALDPK